MTTKDESIVCFQYFKQLNENLLSLKIKNFQDDGAFELVKVSLRKFLDESGITVCASCPHTPQKNGVAKRKHRHITEMGNTMEFQACTPKSFWYDSYLTDTFVINRTPSKLLGYKTPYEVLFHKKPDFSILKVFVCTCYPFLGPYRKDKLSPKSAKCTFIGYSPMHKGYKCYDNNTKKTFISRHVVFEESSFPFCTCNSTPSELDNTTITLPISLLPDSLPTPDTTTDTSSFNDSGSLDCTSPPQSPHSPPVDSSSPPDPSTELIVHPHPLNTRSKMGIFKPKLLPDFVTHHSVAHLLHSAFIGELQQIREPMSFKTSFQSPVWRPSMDKEYNALQQNNTCTLVECKPSMNVLGCKWVYKVKLNSDGTVERCKSRLVAKGFHQVDGVDFNETFSPMVKVSTIRVLLTLVVSNGWHMQQLDVFNAFLHGDLNETIYMHQTPGYVDPTKPKHVCKLNKSIYGLKPSPKAWFEKFSGFLINVGFIMSDSDHSLFLYLSGVEVLLLLLYVDDIILIGSSTELLSRFVSTLNTSFAMKDLGELHYL